MRLVLGVRLCLFALIALVFMWSFDVADSASRYLYFSSLVATALVGFALYFATFSGVAWNAPPNPLDKEPKANWNHFRKGLLWTFGLLTALMVVLWISLWFREPLTLHAWLKRGVWAGFMLGVYLICMVVVRKNIRCIAPKPLIFSTAVMVYFLTTYEVILLDRGIGWHYNQTIIQTVFGIPIDNVLFTYPIAPAFAVLMYIGVLRRHNPKKAFWLINGLLAPASVAFELLAVYGCDIWSVHSGQSVWPMGRTSLEEMVFYILMQFTAIALYAFFDRALKGSSSLRK